MKNCLDASSLIHCFKETYPPSTFPSLYEKIKLFAPKIVLIKPIFSEIKKLVTEEKKQTETPKERSSYKIPLVCQEESVRCVNFIEFLQENKVVI